MNFMEMPKHNMNIIRIQPRSGNVWKMLVFRGCAAIWPGFVATGILNPEKKYPMLLKLRKASDEVMKAIRRKRRIYMFDWKFCIIVFFWRLVPRLKEAWVLISGTNRGFPGQTVFDGSPIVVEV